MRSLTDLAVSQATTEVSKKFAPSPAKCWTLVLLRAIQGVSNHVFHREFHLQAPLRRTVPLARSACITGGTFHLAPTSQSVGIAQSPSPLSVAAAKAHVAPQSSSPAYE